MTEVVQLTQIESVFRSLKSELGIRPIYPDTKLIIEKLKWPLPNQPPPRLVAQKDSSEIEVQTVR